MAALYMIRISSSLMGSDGSNQDQYRKKHVLSFPVANCAEKSHRSREEAEMPAQLQSDGDCQAKSEYLLCSMKFEYKDGRALHGSRGG